MQFQADVLQVDVVRPKVYETTALGAAYLSGLATGFWKNLDEIQKQWQVNAKFSPAMSKEKINELQKGWQRAVNASIVWADDKG
jgi:glycerol kinase